MNVLFFFLALQHWDDVGPLRRSSLRAELVLHRHYTYLSVDDCRAIAGERGHCKIMAIAPNTPPSLLPEMFRMPYGFRRYTAMRELSAFLGSYWRAARTGLEPKDVEAEGIVFTSRELGPGRGFGPYGELRHAILLTRLRDYPAYPGREPSRRTER